MQSVLYPPSVTPFIPPQHPPSRNVDAHQVVCSLYPKDSATLPLLRKVGIVSDYGVEIVKEALTLPGLILDFEGR